MKASRLSIVLMLAALTGAACGMKEAPGTQSTTANHNAAAPANTNAAGATVGTTATAGVDGAKLYNTIGCAVCHGADGKGNATMKDIPNFTDAAWQKKATDAEMTAVIQNGKTPMPSYKGRLTDEQIKALVGYIRGLAK